MALLQLFYNQGHASKTFGSTEIDSEVESPDPYPLLDQLANVEKEVGERMEDDSSSSEGDVYHHYL